MNQLNKKIMHKDFPQFFKKFLGISLAVILLCGIVTGIAWSQQISEAASYKLSHVSRKAELVYNRQSLLTDMQQNTVPAREARPYKHDDGFKYWAYTAMTPPSAFALASLGFSATALAAIAAIYWLTVAAWVYQAAVRAQMHGGLWLVLALLGNVLAAVLFVIARSFLRQQCPHCNAWFSKKYEYCTECGSVLYQSCDNCHAICSEDETYCHGCGHKLQAQH